MRMNQGVAVGELQGSGSPVFSAPAGSLPHGTDGQLAPSTLMHQCRCTLTLRYGPTSHKELQAGKAARVVASSWTGIASSVNNPASQAHLDDLRTRLSVQLGCAPYDPAGAGEMQALVDALVGVVRAMDRGALTSKDALEAFTRHRIPGFSFGPWLVEMVDDDVYHDAVFNEAA